MLPSSGEKISKKKTKLNTLLHIIFSQVATRFNMNHNKVTY